MTLPLEDRSPDRRAFFRVRTRLSLGMRAVSPAQVAWLRTEILRRSQASVGDLPPGLADWLTRIEEKLDLLLAKGGLAEAPELHKRERVVVLSGNGLLLPDADVVPELGSTLLVELDLPLRPRHRVRCLARVTGTRSEAGEAPALALGFSCIHEQDRDAIVRHNLIVQRAQLRAGADASGTIV